MADGDLASRAEALERDRDEATRAAVAHERARIARELHDLVAHSLAVIVLQAQAADRVLATDARRLGGHSAAIDTTGREGLDELRRLLDILVDLAPTSSSRDRASNSWISSSRGCGRPACRRRCR